MEQKTTGGRIREVRKEQGLKQPEFARSIGISQGHLSEMETGKARATEPILLAIEYRYTINREWLLTGNGPKYSGGDARSMAAGEYDIRDPELMLIIDTLLGDPSLKGKVYKDLHPAEAGVSLEEKVVPFPVGGPAARLAAEEAIPWEDLKVQGVVARKLEGLPEELKDVYIYSMDFIREPKNQELKVPLESIIVPGHLARRGPVAFRADDEAMAPTIKNGAIFGLDHKERDIFEGNIYIIKSSKGGVFLRRVSCRRLKIILKPDNAAFPEEEFSPAELKVIGRVRWVIQNL